MSIETPEQFGDRFSLNSETIEALRERDAAVRKFALREAATVIKRARDIGSGDPTWDLGFFRAWEIADKKLQDLIAGDDAPRMGTKEHGWYQVEYWQNPWQLAWACTDCHEQSRDWRNIPHLSTCQFHGVDRSLSYD